MNKKINTIPPVSRIAKRLLIICIIPIVTAFVALTFSFIEAAAISPAHAMMSYPDMFTYIYSAILLALLGGFLLDTLERKKR